MDKFSKNERVAYLFKLLTDSPGKQFTLIYFANIFNCAKSTVSDDINSVANLVGKLELGYIESLYGAGGGVMYIPSLNNSEARTTLSAISSEIQRNLPVINPELLRLDILSSTKVIDKLARIFAAKFLAQDIQYIFASGKHSIAIAYSAAQRMDVPLLTAGDDASLGAQISVSYLNKASISENISVISLPTRSIQKGSNVLYIDTLLTNNYKLNAVNSLISEFDSELIGAAFCVNLLEQSPSFRHIYSLITIDVEAGSAIINEDFR